MRDSEKLTCNEMQALLHDQPFSVSHDYIRNSRTFFRRFQNEGFSFLSKTIPSLGKALDRALSGKVAFSLPSTFKKYKKTCFPHFLGSALRRIFDETGYLLDSPCYNTVAWLRSFCYYAYKIEVPFEEAEIQEFSRRFVETDSDIGNLPLCGDDSTVSVRNLMRALLSSLDDEQSTPQFGPGISSNCKRTEKWNEFVPPSLMRMHFGRDFFLLNGEHWLYELFVLYLFSYLRAFLGVNWNSFEGYCPSKILFVPKDSRGPRTICCEDSRLMYAQKSLQKSLYSQVERGGNFAGRVNFTDQTINQKLTFDHNNATLDLKDASDRISLDLVIDVFPPKLLKSLLACRSSHYSLPDGSIRVMEKFAPMGSALCFPIMALIAYSAVVAAISLNGGSLMHRQNRVFVYGDDIIVPNEYAEISILALESIGLRVNRDKSFVDSRFRESCGQDTLDSSTVNPLRKKKAYNKLLRVKHKGRTAYRDDANYLAHVVSLYNSSRRAGFTNHANFLENHIDSLATIPYGTTTSGYLCKHVSPELVRPYNQAAGYEFKGKLRALVIIDDNLEIKFKTNESRLRRMLLEGGGEKPLDPSTIGARSTTLQYKKLQPWGCSYH